MKKKLLNVAGLVLGLIFALPATTIFAGDAVPHGAVPLINIVKNIYAAGYITIYHVEYDDGFYHAEVINAQGKKVGLKINRQTGNVPAQPKAVRHISMLHAVKIAANTGCARASEVELDDDYYKVKCLEKNNQQYEIFIDTQTGAVIRKNSD